MAWLRAAEVRGREERKFGILPILLYVSRRGLHGLIIRRGVSPLYLTTHKKYIMTWSFDIWHEPPDNLIILFAPKSDSTKEDLQSLIKIEYLV